MVNLRKTCQIELTDIHPQHVVCAWLGNSEDVAKKHYLKVTDGHMSAGSLLTASPKAGPKAGPNLSLGELTCRLIERWDELDNAVKTEIAELLSHD